MEDSQRLCPKSTSTKAHGRNEGRLAEGVEGSRGREAKLFGSFHAKAVQGSYQCKGRSTQW
jgi:hypothetical protein